LVQTSYISSQKTRSVLKKDAKLCRPYFPASYKARNGSIFIGIGKEEAEAWNWPLTSSECRD